MSETRSVYLTFPDVDTAMSIGQTLLTERLIACLNVLPRATSIYRWEGQIVSQEEVVAFAKTTADRLAALSDRVAELHPFEVPCIVALDVVGGLPTYLQWVADETS